MSCVVNPNPITEAASLEALMDEVIALRGVAVQRAATRLEQFESCFPGGRCTSSAANLAHYLAVRQHELRSLQDRLAEVGLSSLGRGEAHILANLDSVIDILSRLTGLPAPAFLTGVEDIVTHAEGRRILEEHTARLFGPKPAERQVRIMVTFASDNATDYDSVRQLLLQGMDCARINCAHDDRTTWRRMIDHIRRGVAETGRPCRILMDLAGQKLRTGPIVAGPAVRHLKVRRDPYGAVVEPATVLIGADTPPGELPAGAGGPTHYSLTIPAALHKGLLPDDRLSFTDTRGKRRHLEITGRSAAGDLVAQCRQSAYLAADTRFEWYRRGASGHYRFGPGVPLVPFRGEPVPIRLFRGDPLRLAADGAPGRDALRREDGQILEPARINCSHAEAVSALRTGHAVWIDDGKIGTVVEAVQDDGVLLRVTEAAPQGAVVREDKGLNFPDTELSLPALTDKDLADLDFVSEHADMVGFSFVQSHEDVQQLVRELERRNAAHLPVIAKIETRRAVSNLPGIILGTIGRHPLGIMIARGDLAVELGSVRLAEIQEEILWLCEAAHVPVIWATQVLESMAKKGMPSRAEVSDAAMSVEAECVMLNKGPYVVETVRFLRGVLERMSGHTSKRQSMLRRLSVSQSMARAHAQD
jgi:pyruvate kinase